jgi:S1-C subfamily serine protease
LFLTLALLTGGAPAAPTAGPTLGVVVGDLTFEQIDELGISLGVRVHAVVPESPAAEAGVESGDIIIALDGAPIYSPQRLQWILSKQPPGEPVVLSIRRGEGETAEVIELKAVPTLPQAEEGIAQVPGTMDQRAWLGVRMQPMTSALEQQYAVPRGRGVLIADVGPQSPAARAGLLPGDVLVRIDRRTVRSLGDVYRALAFFDPGETVELEVVREGETTTLEATLGGKAVRGGMPFYHPYGHPNMPRPRFWMEPPPESWPKRMEEFRDLMQVPPPLPRRSPAAATPGREIAL